MDQRLDVVFIFSPVRWGRMKVSKHHYALELARRGVQTFYFEPPNIKLPKRLELEHDVEGTSLTIVRYRPVFRGKSKLPAFVYRQLLELQINRFYRRLGVKPNWVISFDSNRWEDLRLFKPARTMYFAADVINPKIIPGEILTAHVCVGVSDTIVASLLKYNVNSHFIPHGLSQAHVETARLIRSHVQSNPVQGKMLIGYVGNLLMEALDRDTMKRVIEANPSCTFIFWGQYERKQDNMIAYEIPEVFAFVDFLKTAPNVILRGPLSPEQLQEELAEINLFWICYAIGRSWLWDGSNSHKLMEYLATGKPVVAHHVSSYRNSPLIDMLPDASNEGYLTLFDSVLQRVREGESVAIQQQRIDFALEHAYANNLEKLIRLAGF